MPPKRRIDESQSTDEKPDEESEEESEDEAEIDATRAGSAVLAMLEDARNIILKRARTLAAEVDEAYQGAPGSEDVSDRYTQAALSAPPATVAGPIAQGQGGVSKTTVLATTRGATSTMRFANNVTFRGKWAADGLASGAGPKNAVRDLQLLNQISQLLLSIGKSTEIEAMVVNDRILVSANEAGTVQEMIGRKLADLAEGYQPSGDADYDRKARKTQGVLNVMAGDDDALGEERMARLAVDTDVFPEQEPGVTGILAALSQAYLPIIDGGLPNNAATLITNAALECRIIAVNTTGTSPSTCVHAEQSLAQALVLSGWRGPASIAGGKRPCLFCYVSLRLVQELHCPQLRFNRRPGGVWTGTTATGLYGLLLSLGADEAMFRRAVTAAMSVPQYVTDPRPGAEPAAEVTGMGDAVTPSKGRGFRTDTGTPSDSEAEEEEEEDSD
ncbi:hypothetical protein AB5J62_22420 [Amycolatopsis sp. cg5]|uniref:hypothetical protein n=1 Tax=Amycolatopsis sp. cg5 TaxID=3238802 RepID=UPI0035262B1A